MPYRRIHETELLSRIARALAESLELKRTLAGVLEALEVHMALQMGTINLLDPDSETIKIAVAHNIDSELQKQIEYREGEGITGIVYQSGEPVIVPDIQKDKRFLAKAGERKPKEDKKMAFICVPIKVEGKTAGAMSVSKETSSGKSLQNDARILNVIATMVGQAVKINDLYTKEKRGWQEENLKLRQQLRNRFKIHNMIGSSNAMQEVFRLVEQVAQSNATVMIRGESGTGKDLIAHAIHYSSLRADKPFIKINCTALPESLLESELFGHEKGRSQALQTGKSGALNGQTEAQYSSMRLAISR
ncbi:Nif-specific regulatory protein [Sedimentisphaera cyanobacteriorum]|uniref:Nif-specific regulatory protein n=1 Tax=Sedimentisphaera cyanobacteriorum TaxID=1940790 RepID=A0A1Q2HPQ1_9BACT|nr:sigma 54-interacting transcriptional regulator [Sedimentisphaera cyanobacteriorum]AQQ09226.1 Nif-specific regulatory protein [Sedimentisphaera cyanobacteriorum]